MQMMNGGGGFGGSESLQNDEDFNFTQMQNHYWLLMESDNFILNSDFLSRIANSVKEDEEQSKLFYGTLFDKMYLNLNSIKIEKLKYATDYIETTRILLEYKDAQDVFVNSRLFLKQGLNGKKLQHNTYLGRYLSFSCIFYET